MKRYNHEEIESEMQKRWSDSHVYKTESFENGEKKYILSMFPYPSGSGLHVGHARIYTGTDVLARFYRMNGCNVLHPMGWDAFGLPAENAAIKQNTNPMKLVPQNIAHFKDQAQKIGLSYDWDREIATTDPQYYAITQWLFIQFYAHGLLYRKNTPVYYCESCKTGLAQEEVLGDGTHERCGNKVTKKDLPQWVFRITEYADSLLKGLNDLQWPNGILEMQKNWIGKKKGVEIDYPVENTNETISCFTTRPETQFGATFVVLSPEHSFSQKLLSGELVIPSEASEELVKKYIADSLTKTERERQAKVEEKTGVFTGYYAINRLSGEKMPIWIADYVLAQVGTGAVVGVPAHDKRDYEFASKFGLNIKEVISSPKDSSNDIFEGDGEMIDSDFLNGLSSQEAYSKATSYLSEKGWGKEETTYHLRDWIFSRQRYWGEPIPMVYCQSCDEKGINLWNSKVVKKLNLRLDKGPDNNSFKELVDEISQQMNGWFPINREELPLELPMVESYEPSENGESPLAAVESWTQTKCPECGGVAMRETDTMPNWAGSCWYFLQFAQANISFDELQAKDVPFDESSMNQWLPVDWYVGGAEHAVLHLLYARFWIHALNDMSILPFREPFTRLENVGMLLAENGSKMSKSKGNTVNPDDVIMEYGSDALRVYVMFMAPFSQEVAWSMQTLQGSYRFIKRIWQIYNNTDKIVETRAQGSKKAVSELQRTIVKITSDIPNVKFNTPIASMMEFLNVWEKDGIVLSKQDAETFLKLLAPFAPHISDYIWKNTFSHDTSIHISEWPIADSSLLLQEHIMIPVQINGKVRDTLSIDPSHLSEDEVVSAALKSVAINKWIDGSEFRVIYVPGKILNLVTKS